MLILIHGTDTVSSRRKLNELSLVDNNEKTILDGKRLLMEKIVPAVESKSLFRNSRIIIVENFFQGKLAKDKEEILSYVSKIKTTNSIIFWQNKEISKTVQTKYFSNAKIYAYQIPVLMFKFLDSIFVVSKNTIMDNFQKLLLTTDAEFIYSMIVRQFRFLIIASDPAPPQNSTLNSWQLSKLKNQLRFSSVNSIMANYRRLLAIDYRVKTGGTPFSLIELLDLFLLNL